MAMVLMAVGAFVFVALGTSTISLSIVSGALSRGARLGWLCAGAAVVLVPGEP